MEANNQHIDLEHYGELVTNPATIQALKTQIQILLSGTGNLMKNTIEDPQNMRKLVDQGFSE